MKKVLLAIGVMVMSSAAQAAPVFSDNFDANSLGLNAIPIGWSVTSGTVDIIGAPPAFHDLIPGSGKYIDLDGSTSDAGILSRTLSLNAGTQYTATFDLAGNQRNASPETVTGILGVGIGNVSNTFSLAQSAGWSMYSLVFTPASSGNYVLSFGNSGGDNVGMLLDNVNVSSPVPEPASLALLGLGLAGLGFARRRKA